MDPNPTNQASTEQLYATGDILIFTYVWDYDQTNVEWYQIIRTTRKTIVVRQIDAVIGERGRSLPVPNAFIGPPLRKRVQSDGYVSMAYGCLCRWNGKPMFSEQYPR